MGVAVHAKAILSDTAYHGFQQVILPLGHAGVDIFFVISGFIMVYVTPRDMSALQFLRNRILRVAPLYYLITFVTFGFALFLPGLMQSTEANIGHLIKSLLFVPFEKSNGYLHPTVFVGWTLNYEMMFYALFGIALLMRRHLVAAAIALVLAVLLANLTDGVVQRFYGNPIVLEFVACMLVATQLRRLRSASLGAGLALDGIALLLALELTAPELHRVINSACPRCSSSPGYWRWSAAACGLAARGSGAMLPLRFTSPISLSPKPL